MASHLEIVYWRRLSYIISHTELIECIEAVLTGFLKKPYSSINLIRMVDDEIDDIM